MGTGETGTPTKAAKISTTQEQQSAPTTYPEWAAAFQAYYNSGGQAPPGYFPPAVASGPQPHPYMWGGQPMMPPYGTPPPPPYGAMYPHGTMYGHPSMPQGAHPYVQYGIPSPGGNSEGTMATPAAIDAEGQKTTESGKDRSPMKRSKGSLGSLGMLTGKGSDGGIGNSGSANGVFSQSGESGSEGSSEGSEEENAQDVQMMRKRSYDQMTLEVGGVASGNVPAYNAQAGGAFVSPVGVGAGVQTSGITPAGGSAKLSVGGGPTTNLGIGIQDYWSGSTPGSHVKGGKRGATSASTGMVPSTASTQLMAPGGREGVPPELWLQDEREVKRQRRKQSNRESARRSRLRKQAECEELGTRVDTLTVENMALRTELTRMTEECKKLTADNASLLEKLRKSQGTESGLEQGVCSKDDIQVLQSEGNGKLMDGSNTTSPSQDSARKSEEAPGNSAGKAATPFDSGAHSETVSAG